MSFFFLLSNFHLNSPSRSLSLMGLVDRWMVQERDWIFQKEYESVNVQYQNLSRS